MRKADVVEQTALVGTMAPGTYFDSSMGKQRSGLGRLKEAGDWCQETCSGTYRQLYMTADLADGRGIRIWADSYSGTLWATVFHLYGKTHLYQAPEDTAPDFYQRCFDTMVGR